MNENNKHPMYNDELLRPNEDIFKPEFKRDSRGSYFMQLPGYGKWMVSNEPGSKIIAQGSQDEAGGAATDPGSIRTGSLHANTIISVGESIYLDGGTGCIHVGDYLKRVGPSMSICGSGMRGFSGPNSVFAFFLSQDGDFGTGDVFIGDYASEEYLLWDDSEGKLYLKGDLVIAGDIESDGYPPGYKLEYLTGIGYFNSIVISGGSIDSPITLSDGQTIGDVTAHVIATGNTHQADIDDLNDAQLYMDRVDETILWDVIDNTAYYIQKLWTQKIVATGGSETSGVIIDRDGIRGYDGSAILRFKLNANTGDFYFGNFPTGNYMSWDTGLGVMEVKGKITATSGNIGGWDVDSDRLWKQIPASGLGPPYSKLELNVRESAGVDMHMQAFTDDNSNYTSPTGVQITTGASTSPNPRLDIFDDGTKRVTLDTTGLRFYASDGTTVTSKILMGTADGDVTFGGGNVRIWSDGIRVSYPQAISLASSSSSVYFRLYCSGAQAIIESANDSYGIAMRRANGSTNICAFLSGSITCYEPVRPDTDGGQNLGSSSRHWNNVYASNIVKSGTLTMWMTNSFVIRESGSSVWSFYFNGSDSYMGAGSNDAKLHASNNFTIDTNSGSIWLNGNVSKTSGTFTIDHPLAPKTHLLQHSFVESPEMMNLYRGRATLSGGKAIVTMPDWFVALNGEDQSGYSYHLTSVGGQNDLWVDTEIDTNGKVTFAGTKDMSFDYLITATRNDPWAVEKRVEVEVTKESVGLTGKYIYPEYYSDEKEITGDARMMGGEPGEPSIN